MSRMLWILMLCGAATFALRWLPLWRTRRRGRASSRPPCAFIQRWLAGVGPAAIAALLAVSVSGLPGAGTDLSRMLCIALALAVIGVVHRAGAGIALPTLAGALAYGLMAYFQRW